MTAEVTTTPEGTRTPWGKAQVIEKIADGIEYIQTASHGGYRVSKERLDKMPAHLRLCSFTDNEYFEHDCSWCAVVLAFPECFKSDMYQMAKSVYQAEYETVYYVRLHVGNEIIQQRLWIGSASGDDVGDNIIYDDEGAEEAAIELMRLYNRYKRTPLSGKREKIQVDITGVRKGVARDVGTIALFSGSDRKE